MWDTARMYIIWREYSFPCQDKERYLLADWLDWLYQLSGFMISDPIKPNSRNAIAFYKSEACKLYLALIVGASLIFFIFYILFLKSSKSSFSPPKIGRMPIAFSLIITKSSFDFLTDFNINLLKLYRRFNYYRLTTHN